MTRSSSVHQLNSSPQEPAFNVFVNGLFQLEDFGLDGPQTTKSVNSSEEDNIVISSNPSDSTAVECNGVMSDSSAKSSPLPSLGWPLAGKVQGSHSKSGRSAMRVHSMEKHRNESMERHRNESMERHRNESMGRHRNESMEKHRNEHHLSDMDLMKERFSKLLLGEDMSGGSKGVSSALALSNAITNLSAAIFGDLWRLEPMAPERKTMWRKETDWLLSVTDYIVELVPSRQCSVDGTQMEIMVTKARSDLQMNIPALRKLDAMLLEVLEKFRETEFWYEDRSMSDSSKERGNQQRKDHKWWLPTPKIPRGGLSDSTRKLLLNQRDSLKQILKAAMAINAQVLSEMEIPEVYLESLPKNGRASLGDTIYRHITSDQFSPEALLSSLDLSSEQNILDLKNRVEASIVIWKRKMSNKENKPSISSWGSTVTHERREVLGERAETLLLLLKQRYPGIPQTILDMNKIQYNKDVGQSILESYSRVLESLSFNILSRIDDVLYADNQVRGPAFPDPSFDRSPSSDSMTLNSTSEDQTSLWTRASTPYILQTPVSSPSRHHDIPVVADVQPGASPLSMTLSDYIGWQIVHPHDNDSLSKLDDLSLKEALHQSPLNQHHHAKSLKKLPVIVTNKQRLSYLEKLEHQGVMHSPAARD